MTGLILKDENVLPERDVEIADPLLEFRIGRHDRATRLSQALARPVETLGRDADLALCLGDRVPAPEADLSAQAMEDWCKELKGRIMRGEIGYSLMPLMPYD